MRSRTAGRHLDQEHAAQRGTRPYRADPAGEPASRVDPGAPRLAHLGRPPALEQGLDRAFDSGSDRVVLDLPELEFIDSSGLRSLLMARRRAENARKYFALVAGSRD